jgi:hypothetical protein
MAECGRGSVIALPALGSFCSTQVNLTMPSDLIGLMTAFIAIPRNDGSRSYGEGWGSRGGQLRVDPGLLNHCPVMALKSRLM